MPTIDANGLTIGYDTVGAGPPLVLLHGATSDAARDFREILPALSKAFRCYTPDARGHGRTRWDADTGGFSADWLADDLLAFADALGLETFHLLGFSLGAMTALRVAVRAPERLRTLVVMSITCRARAAASVGPAAHGPGPDRSRRPGLGGRPLAPPRPGQGAGAGAAAPAIARDVATQPLLTPRQIRAIDAPTLVVAGDRDPFVPVDAGLRPSPPGRGRPAARPARRRATTCWPTDLPLLEAALRRLLPIDRAVARERAGETDHGGHDMTTLLALYRRPDGGAEALAEFERRYAAEHLPLVAQTPGLRSTEVQRVSDALGARPTSCWSPRCSSTTARPWTPGWRRTRCGPPVGTCARSRRGCRRCSSWRMRTNFSRDSAM